jgi:hypothetical protein
VFLLLFLYGWLIGKDVRLSQAIRRLGPAALALVVPATALGFAVYVRALQVGIYLGLGYTLQAVLWRVLKGLGAWWWIIAMLGLCGAWLEAHAGASSQGGPRVRRFLDRAAHYANEAVLPFYVLHHPVVLAIGFLLVRWEASVWLKYLAVSSASLTVTVVVYDWLIKRVGPVRCLFGMRRRERTA